ncbi:MAG: hypothetical protein UZ16_OP3001000933 [Candidatus Hinthialibacteria bacterium OLB16]|nr:MAG: hypothetical protein UZ16_OP3001000933 [Candidatus Hinthialibacteria bacterium OLB16]
MTAALQEEDQVPVQDSQRLGGVRHSCLPHRKSTGSTVISIPASGVTAMLGPLKVRCRGLSVARAVEEVSIQRHVVVAAGVRRHVVAAAGAVEAEVVVGEAVAVVNDGI